MPSTGGGTVALGSSGTAWNGRTTRGGVVVVAAGPAMVVAVTAVVGDWVADAGRGAAIDVGGAIRGWERSPGLSPAETNPAARTTAMLAADPQRAIADPSRVWARVVMPAAAGR